MKKCTLCKDAKHRVMRWEFSPYHKNSYTKPVECISKNTAVDGHFATTSDFQVSPIQHCKKVPTSSPEESCDACEDPQNPTKKLYVDKTITPNKCIETCPKNEYKYVDNNDHCVNCPLIENCGECDLSGCTRCKPGFGFEKGTKTCVDCSAAGKFIDENNECDECMGRCDECSTKDNCQKCSGGFYLLISSSGQSRDQCVICDEKNKFRNLKNQCQPCQEGCSDCDNFTHCNKCSQSGTNGFLLFLQPDQSGCSTQCPDNHYKDKSSQKCLKCPLHCKSIFGEISLKIMI